MIALALAALAACANDPLAPLPEAAMPAAPIIRRGENVSLKAGSGSLDITTAGRALNDAGAGDRVRVVVIATKRTVEAVAEAPGTARLTKF